jgi:uncharacterized protein (TIGR02271 family)
MRQPHPSKSLLSELAVLAGVLLALVIASLAGGLRAPTLWTLVAVAGGGYLVARGASRGEWRSVSRRRPGGTAGAERSQAFDGAAMTASEERLSVDKQTRLRERVRLRKYVVTEQVQVTVPVRREHLRLERELIPEGESDAGVAELGAPMPDYSIVLLEETVVVDKRVVPRERVTVHKEVVTEQQQISETVRREQIDFERDEVQRGTSSPTEEETT